MTDVAVPSPNADSLTAASHAEPISIATRFGDLEVDPGKVITFAQGLYGLEQQHRFLLIDGPGWPDFFKLLQAVDDPNLSLIVLPIDVGDGPIDEHDFVQACEMLGYSTETTAIVAIVTMRNDGDTQVFTVNLKAPLLIESERRLGHQHVFASEKYHLRHPLTSDQRIGN